MLNSRKKKQSAHVLTMAVFMLAVALVIVCAVLLLSTFNTKSTDRIERMDDERLMEFCRQSASVIDCRVDSAVQYVKSGALALEAYENLSSRQSMEVLKRIKQNSPFENMWMLLDDHVVFLYDDASEISVSMYEYIYRDVDSISGVSDVFYGSNSDKLGFCVRAPIFDGEGNERGALVGFYDPAKLDDKMLTTAFGGLAYNILIQSSGTVILSPGAEVSPLHTGSNAIKYIESAKFCEGSSKETLLADLANGALGEIELIINGEKRHVYYAPVGTNDWYMLSVVPQVAVDRSANDIKQEAVTLTTGVAAAFLMMIAMISIYGVIQMRRERSISKRLDFMTNVIPCGVLRLSMNRSLDIRYASQGFYNITGYDKDTVRTEYSNSFLNMIYPKDRAMVEKLLRNSADAANGVGGSGAGCDGDSGGQLELQFRMNVADGSRLWVFCRCSITQGVENARHCYCMIVDINGMKAKETELVQKSRRLEMAMDNTGNAVFEYDIKERLIVFAKKPPCSGELATMLEKGLDYVRESGSLKEEQRRNLLAAFKEIDSGAADAECVIRVEERTGDTSFRRVALSVMSDERGMPARAVGTIEDVTDERRAKQRLLREIRSNGAMRAKALFVFVVDITKDSVVEANIANIPVATDKYGSASIGLAMELIRHVHKDDIDLLRKQLDIQTLRESHARGGDMETLEFRFMQGESSFIWAMLTLYQYTDPESGDDMTTIYVTDIDERKKNDERLHMLAERDPLTGLFNRRCMELMVSEVLKKSGVEDGIHAFMIIDVDDFKGVNDTYGHQVGDELLCSLASKLRQRFRADDAISRLGGDEFLIFMHGLRSENLARLKAAEICKMAEGITLENADTHISVSVGVAIFPKHGSDFATLYKMADKALYAAKYQGRDRAVMYSPSLELDMP